MTKLTTKARAVTRKQKAVREIAERHAPTLAELAAAVNRLAAAIEVYNMPRGLGQQMQGLGQGVYGAQQGLHPHNHQYGLGAQNGKANI